MKVNYTFRKRNWSNHLVEYAAKKTEKLKKFESHNPFNISVTFMDEKHDRVVNLLVECDGETYTAKTCTDDYFDALDMAFEKVMKQIEKTKTKTKSGKMRRMKSEKANLQALESLRRKAA
jgi:putative sigma-54 modulation protein